MKTLGYTIVLCAVLLTSCVSRNTADKLQNQRDSLSMVVSEKDSLIGEIFGAINTISENLSVIKTREQILTLDSNKEGTKRPMDQINEDITAIDRLLLDNKTKIEALERSAARLRKANVKIKGLEKTISNLTVQLSDKNTEISQLKGTLEQMGAKVDMLNEEVAQKSTQVENLTNKKGELESEVKDKTAQLHTVYYIVGSQKELLNAQIINKKGFIGRTLSVDNNRNLDSFTQGDNRFMTDLPIGHKSITIVTSHPEDSYQLVMGDDKVVKSLLIKDPDNFWRNSKILVISYK